MKVIDLLNKIAKGEEVPKKIRINHWCYKFEWVEHLENYYDEESDIDLMGVLSMNTEELNYEVEIIEEQPIIFHLPTPEEDWDVNLRLTRIEDKIKELADVVNKMK